MPGTNVVVRTGPQSTSYHCKPHPGGRIRRRLRHPIMATALHCSCVKDGSLALSAQIEAIPGSMHVVMLAPPSDVRYGEIGAVVKTVGTRVVKSHFCWIISRGVPLPELPGRVRPAPGIPRRDRFSAPPSAASRSA